MEKTSSAALSPGHLERRTPVAPAGAPHTAVPGAWRLLTRLSHWLLGADPKQRIRLMQCGMAMLLVLGSVANMRYLVWAGFAPAEPVAWWSLGLIGGFATFFLLIRFNRNLSLADPSLTVPQMAYAIVFAAIGYALAGEGRGGAFPILMVTFMFGMYSLPPAHMRGIGLFAVAVFGLTMLVMARRNPAVFDPKVEWGHFIMIAIMVPAISLLAAHLSGLRARMRRQKRDLAMALGRIQELATRDELTGLINRRHMYDLIEQERQRGVRSGQTFCIAVLELDDYERTRAERGAEAADLLLQRFAQEALHVVRISDILCRWDDQRFMLLLSNTRSSLARLGLERLHERSRRVLADVAEPSVRMTFTAGVIEHRAGESVSQTVQRAEAALAAALAAGRDRVLLA